MSNYYWHPDTLRCLCHGLDCCPTYESWCDEQDEKQWWNSLTDEERESLTFAICPGCFHAFKNKDGETICDSCKNWITIEEEYGVNF